MTMTATYTSRSGIRVANDQKRGSRVVSISGRYIPYVHFRELVFLLVRWGWLADHSFVFTLSFSIPSLPYWTLIRTFTNFEPV